MALKIAIAQINATVGDFAGNAARLADFAATAQGQGADLLLTPELGLCGYPPEDVLLREDFCTACERELDRLASRVSDTITSLSFIMQLTSKINVLYRRRNGSYGLIDPELG